MKNVLLESLTLQNFKGCHDFTIQFNESVTNIFGANGTGKSREQDGFLWLFFGKNSEDKTDFDIKNTKDVSFNQKDHVVYANLNVDGDKIHVKRVYKEKWTKKRGEENAEMTGHTTDYFWNQVPKTQKEFNDLVAGIIDESVFKLITNPLYFNSDKFGKDKRRDILLKICPSKPNEELAGESPEYQELVAKLVQGKTEQDYIKQLNASIKLQKEELKAIPTRIDEALQNKVESFDFDKLELEKSEKETSLLKVETDLTNKSNAFDELLKTENAKKLKLSGVQNKIDTLKQSIKALGETKTDSGDNVLQKATEQLNEKELELKTAENGLVTLSTKETNIKTEISNKETEIQSKREEWAKHNQSEFVPVTNDCNCSHCGALPEHQTINDNEEKLKAFNKSKTDAMETCKNKANSLKSEIDNLVNEQKTITERFTNGNTLIERLKTEVELLKGNIENVKKDQEKVSEAPVFDLEKALSESAEYQTLLKEHATVKATIQENPVIDTAELTEQKNTLVSEIDAIKTKLRNKEVNLNVDNRVIQLKNKQSELAQEIAGVEKELFVVEKFNKLKIQNLEESVNNRFKYVKFKLFESQINGGESEVCEVLVDGVPFSSANTAGKLNAGIDIINVLCEFYQINAPIWIDNRESITELIETNSQVINLFVSPLDNVLRVE